MEREKRDKSQWLEVAMRLENRSIMWVLVGHNRDFGTDSEFNGKPEESEQRSDML